MRVQVGRVSGPLWLERSSVVMVLHRWSWEIIPNLLGLVAQVAQIGTLV